MNARSIVDEIHLRIEQRGRRSPDSGTAQAAATEITALRNAYDGMYQTRSLVGEMPPSPGTRRAQVGGFLIRIMQRSLFWYTPQIRRFQEESTKALASVCQLLERQSETIEELKRELKTLGAVCSAVPLPAADCRVAQSNSVPHHFEFAAQNHFRGPEIEVREKLTHWLDRIQHARAGLAAKGPWLDIGCGRGEWLALLAEAGFSACGIDSNPWSITECRGRGLQAEQADGFDYLSHQADNSLAGITAFHVIEHMPAQGLLTFLSMAHRKLRAGGLLVLETPNPENLRMGACRFWNDPTHVRPVPADFLVFSLNYYGFEVVVRVDLNPAPPAEHLPFREIDLVQRLDDQFFGPQDYGVIGRRAS
jgi:SAM-dependent methyltransferase